MKFRKIVLLMLIAVMLLSAFAGCSKQETTEVPADDPSASGEPTDQEPADDSERVLNIGYVVHVTGLDIMSVIGWGAEAAGEDYNANVSYIGPTSVDNAQQIAMFEQLVATKPDGIVIIAGDPAVWDGPIQNAVDQGIPVLIADADAPDTARHAYFGVDSAQLAADLGKEVKDQIGEAGKVALGVCVLGPASHTVREDGVKSVFQGTGIEVIGPVETQEDATMNYNSWENLYTANPDLSAMVGLSAVETLNMAKVKRDVKGEVIMAAYDPNAESLQMMKDGYLDVCAGQNVFLAGYLPVQALCRSIREGIEIIPGEHYYPGQIITPDQADALIERESGREAMASWYRQYILENNLKDFGLKVK